MTLAELRVTNLGVITDLGVCLGPGMIALTGETGAGKTLMVEAIELLLGGRADPVLVRPGASEAVVEGRLVLATDGDDVVLSRVVPANGRSRAYVNGRMSTLAALEEAAGAAIDLHGQHSHQSLLSAASQRAGLDTFGRIDLAPLNEARRRLRVAAEALAGLGGDGASRARERDMLVFQCQEIDAAAPAGGDEDESLSEEEDRLAHAAAHRDAAEAALAALAGDRGLADLLADAIARLDGRSPLAPVEQRLRGAAIDLADAATELRSLAEGLEDDPERLEWIRQRRHALRQLRRKYGDTLDDVLRYRADADARLAELDRYQQRAAEREAERDRAVEAVAAAEAFVGRQRRDAAPRLAAAVEAQLRTLALPKARLEVTVEGGPLGDEVTWLLAANPGEPARPLSKVASGGELARTMLALRLVLGPAGREAGPDAPSLLDGEASPGTGTNTGRAVSTLVFDEVDAGVGGEAALAVGRALAGLARHHQVLVVTHLAQVAACADEHLVVRKEEHGGRTAALVERVEGTQRVVELSRMLSGQPRSAKAQQHAQELLSIARAGVSARAGAGASA